MVLLICLANETWILANIHLLLVHVITPATNACPNSSFFSIKLGTVRFHAGLETQMGNQIIGRLAIFEGVEVAADGLIPCWE